MKKKILRTLLPVFLLALCLINTKTPFFSSTDRNNTTVQVMPCADSEADATSRDK